VTTINYLRKRIAVRLSLPPAARQRELRLAAGFSIQEIAAAVGVDRATVSRWESGKREPRGDHLDRYVAVLKALEEECEREGTGDEAP
jgi:transcriptional regulator with XRE-family HTH domain